MRAFQSMEEIKLMRKRLCNRRQGQTGFLPTPAQKEHIPTKVQSYIQ